jgi:acyl carrier protein
VTGRKNMLSYSQTRKDEIEKELRKFITDRFLPFTALDSFGESDSFLEKGIIDSTGILELLEFIEEKFEIRVEDEEVVPDNLDSLVKLTHFLGRKLDHARP